MRRVVMILALALLAAPYLMGADGGSQSGDNCNRPPPSPNVPGPGGPSPGGPGGGEPFHDSHTWSGTDSLSALQCICLHPDPTSLGTSSLCAANGGCGAADIMTSNWGACGSMWSRGIPECWHWDNYGVTSQSVSECPVCGSPASNLWQPGATGETAPTEGPFGLDCGMPAEPAFPGVCSAGGSCVADNLPLLALSGSGLSWDLDGDGLADPGWTSIAGARVEGDVYTFAGHVVLPWIDAPAAGAEWADPERWTDLETLTVDLGSMQAGAALTPEAMAGLMAELDDGKPHAVLLEKAREWANSDGLIEWSCALD